jgi:broad specificity phosphatase PhoE
VTKILLAGSLLLAMAGSSARAATGPSADEEEIVFIRHGEKPAAGLGQLSCQGLNRALALPGALAKVVGRPDAIWAARPSEQKEDHGVAYDYVRPLATVEPTAVALGLPVNVQFGLGQPDKLASSIDDAKYDGKIVLVAWEHKQITTIVRDLLEKYGGQADLVPKWPKTDFDSIYIVRIRRSSSKGTARFEKRKEGLGPLPESCQR